MGMLLDVVMHGFSRKLKIKIKLEISIKFFRIFDNIFLCLTV